MKNLFGTFILSLMLASPAWALVDINSAKQSELESVKGIGPAKAKAIVEYRVKNGPFKSLDDLDKVKGFGKASVVKLKGELTIVAEKKPEAKK